MVFFPVLAQRKIRWVGRKGFVLFLEVFYFFLFAEKQKNLFCFLFWPADCTIEVIKDWFGKKKEVKCSIQVCEHLN